ncbi:hypothetical protein [Leptothermofonsia sp. ETS-13]|uniref:hypothetical protein n=1 Tax=Leptothermofonsia sp. ETS-13 TaxID=3035696 RepID=UPI003BA0DC42
MMNSPILTRRVILNLIAIFASVGMVAAVVPVSQPESAIDGVSANAPFSKAVFRALLPE